jgi:hypothetical protein
MNIDEDEDNKALPPLKRAREIWIRESSFAAPETPTSSCHSSFSLDAYESRLIITTDPRIFMSLAKTSERKPPSRQKIKSAKDIKQIDAKLRPAVPPDLPVSDIRLRNKIIRI